MPEFLLLSFEIAGTVAFAVSGAILGLEKRMDILGISILGLTTAVGGGVIRDLILGITPPMTFRDPLYAAIAHRCIHTGLYHSQKVFYIWRKMV